MVLDKLECAAVIPSRRSLARPPRRSLLRVYPAAIHPRAGSRSGTDGADWLRDHVSDVRPRVRLFHSSHWQEVQQRGREDELERAHGSRDCDCNCDSGRCTAQHGVTNDAITLYSVPLGRRRRQEQRARTATCDTGISGGSWAGKGHWQSAASRTSRVRRNAMASARSCSSILSVVFAEKRERTLTLVKSADSLLQ